MPMGLKNELSFTRQTFNQSERPRPNKFLWYAAIALLFLLILLTPLTVNYICDHITRPQPQEKPPAFPPSQSFNTSPSFTTKQPTHIKEHG
jgi:hypothetical protein